MSNEKITRFFDSFGVYKRCALRRTGVPFDVKGTPFGVAKVSIIEGLCCAAGYDGILIFVKTVSL